MIRMMKRVLLCGLLAAVLGGAAWATSYVDWDYEAGYTYCCYDDRDDVYGDNWYAWALRNESYTAQIVTWTWERGVVGVLPGSESLEAEFPLPLATGARPWYNMYYRSDDPSAVVTSTIWWSDGRTVEVPIVMPISAVPEPAGIAGLVIGLIGLMTRSGLRARRRLARSALGV
jgi:hypothetical protein